MLRPTWLTVTILALVLTFGVVHVVWATDELGQCTEFGETNPSTPPEETPSQRCAGLFNCIATPPNVTCRTVDGHCPGTPAQQEIVTHYAQTRVIQLGDCNLAMLTDKCYECKNPKSLICGVTYEYEQKVAMNCAQRCEVPSLTATNGVGRCKP